MISAAQMILLEALKSALFGATPHYPENTNWEEVVAEAKAQTVMSLISTVIPVHDQSVEICKAFYMRILYEQDCLLKHLASAEIPCVILKGSAAALYYPKPFLRTMGDIDILVPHNMYIDAAELLRSKGYDYSHEDARHMCFSSNGIEIELHHRFSSSGFNIDETLEEAIERREYCSLSGYSIPMLPEIENGLVLLGHINQHLKNNMLGLRQILDWEMYLLSISEPQIWENCFVPLATKKGLMTLASYVTKLCNSYLGLANTYSWTDKVNDDLVYELLDVVLTDGNLGRREKSLKTIDARRVRGTIYGIKRYGFFGLFTRVGINKIKRGKSHPMIKPIAFIVGVFVVMVEGIRVLIINKEVGSLMDEGKKRYKLFKKLGVRMGDDIQ